MMKIAAAMFAVLLAGCSGSHSPTEPKDSTVAVAFGHSVTVPGSMTTISFTDIADSRCPQSVVCVWEGDAAVRLESAGTTVVLHTSRGAGPSAARLGEITITLLDVKPAPVTTDVIKKSDYVATLRLTH